MLITHNGFNGFRAEMSNVNVKRSFKVHLALWRESIPMYNTSLGYAHV